MITRIRGRAGRWDAAAQSVEVDVGGLSYEVILPAYAWRALEEHPAEVEFFTHYHVAERHPTPVLIGFLRPVERDFFRKFLTVRGMGWAKATKALATSISTIAQWIEAEDEAALRQLPGVGKRQAAQIVAELRGKVAEEALLRDERYGEPPAAVVPALDRALADAVAALVGLGYQQREAQRWVEEATAAGEVEPDAEAILRAVFQRQAG